MLPTKILHTYPKAYHEITSKQWTLLQKLEDVYGQDTKHMSMWVGSTVFTHDLHTWQIKVGIDFHILLFDKESRNASGKYFITRNVWWRCMDVSTSIVICLLFSVNMHEKLLMWIWQIFEIDPIIGIRIAPQHFLTQSFYIYRIEFLTVYLTHAEIMLICELGHAGKLSITLFNKLERKKACSPGLRYYCNKQLL